jgi:hypothetical protein
MVLMYFLRRILGSDSAAGREVGRDRTTVRNACERVRDRRKIDKTFAKQLKDMETRLALPRDTV